MGKLKISPYCTLNEKYNKSPPILLSLYKKTKNAKVDGLCSVDLDDNGMSFDNLSKLSVFVWIHRVFPDLIPFLMQMQMECDQFCDDAGDDEQLQYVENVEYELYADDFMDVIDEYIVLCNDLKKASKGRQYLLNPLIVNFEKNHACIKQKICKLKLKENGSSNGMLKEIQSLFAAKSKRFEYNVEAMEGYPNKMQKVGMKKFIKQYSSDLFMDKLIKSNGARDQAQPLSV